ncbi:MAG: hypothetical protein O9327_02530 [Polaromonas sp.]|nr:hypothetical protein [Polaromonas sp.]
MPIQTQLQRNAGHPWDGRPGFDLLHVQADTAAELTQYIHRAQAKHWSAWIVGLASDAETPGGLLYKPSGANSAWSDTPEGRHPGGIPL